MVNEAISPNLDTLRRRPLARPVMTSGQPMWWSFNPSGLARIVEAGGFEISARGRPYVLPNGLGITPPRLADLVRRPFDSTMQDLLQTRGDLHCWLLARPAP
jgi:hypothetical protein